MEIRQHEAQKKGQASAQPFFLLSVLPNQWFDKEFD